MGICVLQYILAKYAKSALLRQKWQKMPNYFAYKHSAERKNAGIAEKNGSNGAIGICVKGRTFGAAVTHGAGRGI